MAYKKFIVFGFADYYPGGGMNDVCASFDSEAEAVAFAKAAVANAEEEYVQVFDCDKREIVLEHSR
jgi:hypothetical protein